MHLFNRVLKSQSNLSVPDYSDPYVEFSGQNQELTNPNVWDCERSIHKTRDTPDDLKCLRRLENTVSHIESFLEATPNKENLASSQVTRSLLIRYPSPVNEDIWSDVDLDKFDDNRKEGSNSDIFNTSDKASLSDFHVRDVLVNIRERLETYLKMNEGTWQGNEKIGTGNLEENIANLKSDLERYVCIINQKKENELRKFSENMTNQSKILQMKKAFSRKERLKTHIYETLAPSHLEYALADSESFFNSLRNVKDRVYTKGGFTMRNCYDDNYVFETYSDFSPVEHYTMIINEEKGENLLNDAPTKAQPRYQERERISLIFRDPEKIIKQWQNYQLKTVQKGKSFKLKWSKRHKHKPQDVWGFTLDYHQNQVLQRKLEKERRIR